MYKNYFKRIIDFTLALGGILVTSPIFIVTIISLWISNKGKPFFLQNRPGKHGKIFKIIKFKTMSDKRSTEGQLLSDSERLTTIGVFIRKTSIDEMPQLLNVIIGNMSLIGPRPLLPEYLPLYSKSQLKRHNVKPGITGWAQVNGRNAISWEQKFAFDVWYVDNISFLIDLKILCLTVKKILIKEGITSSTSVTMEKFKGN
jgi:undecaprenyl phosphate N,N'-diacetylbacillosamine 1-phosphate transferase